MARMQCVGAVMMMWGLSARAEEPTAVAAHVATSSNQSLSIDDPASATTIDEKNPKPSEGSAVAERSSREPDILEKRKPAAAWSPLDATGGVAWYRTGIGALAVVLGLIGAIYWLVRRWSPNLKSQNTGAVKVIGRTVMGPRQSCVLVQLGPRLVLVGVSADRMDRLCEVVEPEVVAEILAGGNTGAGGFSAWLHKEAAEFVKGGGHKGDDVDDASSRPKQLGQLLQKLRTAKV